MVANLGSNLLKKIMISSVLVYKRYLSPILPPACRFYPSCSSYALESLQRHSTLRALGLILRRLLRCHPFHAGGHDPVPMS